MVGFSDENFMSLVALCILTSICPSGELTAKEI